MTCQFLITYHDHSVCSNPNVFSTNSENVVNSLFCRNCPIGNIGNNNGIVKQFETAIPPNFLTCSFRGQITRQEICNVGCTLYRNKPFDVYACNHPKSNEWRSECSLHKKHREVKDCLTCDFSEAAQYTPNQESSIKQWAVGITTCPRDIPTLDKCLQTLAIAGWKDVQVFDDPGVGGFHNWRMGIEQLLENHPDADAIFIIQDDTIFASGLRQYLERDLWPSGKVGCVSVYTPSHYTQALGGQAESHFVRLPDKTLSAGVWGACALIFPRHVAKSLVVKASQVDKNRKSRIDVFAGEHVHRMQLEWWTATPSLAQHIGDSSPMNHGNATGRRAANDFVGADFNVDQARPTPVRTRWSSDGEITFKPPIKPGDVQLMRKKKVVGAKLHRSGWPYAHQVIQKLHNPDAEFLLDDFCEQTWCYHPRRNNPITVPWIGIIHHTPNPPKWTRKEHKLQHLIKLHGFGFSISKTCKLLICLSNYLGDWLRENWNVPVAVVHHPTEIPDVKFQMGKFQQMPQVLQVGWYLRNTQLIYQINTKLVRKKLLLIDKWVVEHDNLCKEHFKVRQTYSPDKVEDLTWIEPNDYDELLSRSVVVMEVLDASANNVTIECLARNTPLIVNRHPAVVECLGESYPLFYDDYRQIEKMLTNFSLIASAHNYLKGVDKSFLSLDTFERDLRNAIAGVK